MNGFQKSLDRKIDAARKRVEAEKAKASAPTAGLTEPRILVDEVINIHWEEILWPVLDQSWYYSKKQLEMRHF